jgi:maltose O-acetyltransferase
MNDLSYRNMQQGDFVQTEPIVIGNNVWIGRCANILPGVTIGDLSMIAARSVVSKSITSRSVAVGVPARVIREIICDPDGLEY